jgi:hypothetical protein
LAAITFRSNLKNMRNSTVVRGTAALLFALALVAAQFVESGDARLSAHLELAVDPLMPARVYLFKDDQPFRLSPVQAELPLRLDLFYRERIWLKTADPGVLEVTCKDESHFFLLKGHASFDLPAGHYRVEAYRGLFFAPAVEPFDLRAGETRHVALHLRDWTGGARKEWLSGDDHIHLTRAPEDNRVYLAWLEAEDLNIANFLQLQRQMDAAVQYAFGAGGEARRTGYCIRSGHESRSEFFGHINLLGGREMLRPLSVGSMYANSPEVWPYPGVLFTRGREVGATVGYAHFQGSMPHSTLLMDLALGRIDFLEVFQFGILKTEAWYELLNAGFQVTGIAGSDFPGPLGRQSPWPRWIPLLGPERTLVKTQATGSPYEAWAEGVRKGNVVVTNGPLVEIGADKQHSMVNASTAFFRPIEKLEIVRNGKTIASISGDGKRTALTLTVRLEGNDSCWIAARAWAQRLPGEPEIQGHTNPLYFLKEGKPVLVRTAREALAKRWRAEVEWYKTAGLVFGAANRQSQFFSDAERALEKLDGPLH